MNYYIAEVPSSTWIVRAETLGAAMEAHAHACAGEARAPAMWKLLPGVQGVIRAHAVVDHDPTLISRCVGDPTTDDQEKE